jgi:hypothetical protein
MGEEIIMSKTYQVSSDKFTTFQAEALKNGLLLTGDKGQVETHGVVMSYAYDGTANLSVTIVSKPWYIPASTVWSELESFMA